MALSPDGRHLVFAGVSDGIMRLWLRSFDSLKARPLPGTESGWLAPPFWSPDSRFIAFGADGKLKKIDLSGNPPQTICDIAGLAVGGSWNHDGVIIYGDYGGSQGIMRVSAAGGSPTPLTKPSPERHETSHFMPAFLPDGRHFSYFCAGRPENAGIYIGSLEGRNHKTKAENGCWLLHPRPSMFPHRLQGAGSCSSSVNRLSYRIRSMKNDWNW